MTVSFTLPLGKDSYTENQLLSKDKIVKSTHAYSDVEALMQQMSIPARYLRLILHPRK